MKENSSHAEVTQLPDWTTPKQHRMAFVRIGPSESSTKPVMVHDGISKIPPHQETKAFNSTPQQARLYPREPLFIPSPQVLSDSKPEICTTSPSAPFRDLGEVSSTSEIQKSLAFFTVHSTLYLHSNTYETPKRKTDRAERLAFMPACPLRTHNLRNSD